MTTTRVIRGWRDEAKRKKGLMGIGSSVVIEEGKGGIRGINGNRKYNKKL